MLVKHIYYTAYINMHVSDKTLGVKHLLYGIHNMHVSDHIFGDKLSVKQSLPIRSGQPLCVSLKESALAFPNLV